jgi:protein TonB
VEVPAAFLSQVSTWLERQRSYPVAARRLGQEGEVLVRLRLDGSGRAVEAALVGTTGHRLLDEAVLRMVEKAQPFPPPPIPMGKTLECLVPVRFRSRP